MSILHRTTIGNVHIIEVDADPNGNATAPKGSLALDSTNGNHWKNTDGATAWDNLSAAPAGTVLEADFNANTVLAATVDDTPVALTLAASTILGRKSTGGPAAMTAAETLTVLGVETAATADQTGAEIKTAYEAEADTNALTDALKTKLDGIAAGATNNPGVEANADVTDDANVRAALAAATADIDINGQALINIAATSQKDHAAFAGSDLKTTTFAAQTTTATAVNALILTLDDDSVYFLNATIMARGTTGASQNAYQIKAKVSREATGSAVLGAAGSVADFTDEEDLDWQTQWVVNGNTARLEVRGEAGITVNWAGHVSYQKVSGSA